MKTAVLIRDRATSFFLNSVMMVATLLFLVPIYITIVNAFKTKVDILTSPMDLPFDRLTLNNLARNIDSEQFNLLIGYGTSLVLATVTTLLVLITASMFSYVLSRRRQQIGYQYIYLLLLLGMMLPVQAILLPIVKILSLVKLMSTVWGVLLVYIGWYMPFAVFTMAGYIGTISPQLDEAALIDGANEWQIFFKVILPLMGPVIASVAIYIIVWTWNDFVTPFIILGSGDFYTVTMGIYRAIGQYTQRWEDVFAILLFAIGPMIVMFLFMQRHFMSGLTAGALKG